MVGSGEANWEGNVVAGGWRRCIVQTGIKEVVSSKSEFMHHRICEEVFIWKCNVVVI